MKSLAETAQVRRAAKKLIEMVDVVSPDKPLNTSQVIALYFWLIDHERLNKIRPVQEVVDILLSGIENQMFDKENHARIIKLCTKILDRFENDAEDLDNVRAGELLLIHT